MHSQHSLSSYSVFHIPWSTFANNSSKAKVFHIMKVESKSISYHAFSLSFSLSLFSHARRRQDAISHFCLKLLPDCLPGLALEYSSSHLHGEQIRQVKLIPGSMWRQRAHFSPTQFKKPPVERYFFKSKSTSYHQGRRQRYLMDAFPLPLLLPAGTRRKKAVGRHLERLNKETDHHRHLVPACRTEKTSREECSLGSCS